MRIQALVLICLTYLCHNASACTDILQHTSSSDVSSTPTPSVSSTAVLPRSPLVTTLEHGPPKVPQAPTTKETETEVIVSTEASQGIGQTSATLIIPGSGTSKSNEPSTETAQPVSTISAEGTSSLVLQPSVTASAQSTSTEGLVVTSPTGSSTDARSSTLLPDIVESSLVSQTASPAFTPEKSTIAIVQPTTEAIISSLTYSTDQSIGHQTQSTLVSLESSKVQQDSASQTAAASQSTSVGTLTSTEGGTSGVTFFAGPSTSQQPMPATIVVGGSSFTQNSASQYVVGSQTLLPGSSAIIEGGNTISLDASATAIVVNGVADAVITASPPRDSAQPVTAIAVGSQVITANSVSQYLVGSHTQSSTNEVASALLDALSAAASTSSSVSQKTMSRSSASTVTTTFKTTAAPSSVVAAAVPSTTTSKAGADGSLVCNGIGAGALIVLAAWL